MNKIFYSILLYIVACVFTVALASNHIRSCYRVLPGQSLLEINPKQAQAISLNQTQIEKCDQLRIGSTVHHLGKIQPAKIFECIDYDAKKVSRYACLAD